MWSPQKKFKGWVGLLMLVLWGTDVGQALAEEPYDVLWAKGAGSSHQDAGQGIATDSSGNVLIAGFLDEIHADCDIWYCGDDSFVAKYDPTGNLLWENRIEGTESEANGVAVDKDGNVFVVGHFTGEIDFGSGAEADRFISHGSGDVFIAKYSSSGRYLWAKQIGGMEEDYGFSIAVDPLGNVFVTGSFRGQADFDEDGDADLRSAAGSNDIFLAKYDPEGSLLWAKRAGGEDIDHGIGIALDSVGNVFVTGVFTEAADFNEDGNPDIKGYDGVISLGDIFLVKYDTDGIYQWAKSAGGVGLDSGLAVTTDRAGNAFITGRFWEDATFGEGEHRDTLNNSGGGDIFIAKYSPLGDYLWARAAGSGNSDVGNGIATDSMGNPFITGMVGGNSDFNGDGSPDLTILYFADAFVAKYSSDGSYLWAVGMGGAGVDAASGIAVNSADNVLVTGSFIGTALFDDISLTSSGRLDIFVAQMGYPPPPLGDRYEKDDSVDEAADLAGWEPLECTDPGDCWLCTAEVRRALLEPDAMCPGVFENGVAPRGAEKIWRLPLSELSLDSGTDRDFYHINIPDPAIEETGGDADIRPTWGPFRDENPVPLPECGFVQREEYGPGGRHNTIYLSIQSTLTIEVIPIANSLTGRPIGTDGEEIGLYRDGVRDSDLGGGPPLKKTILCPRSNRDLIPEGKDLRDLIFSLGERAEERSLSATGGYSLRIEYKVEVEREIPDWVLEETDAIGLGSIGGMPCLNTGSSIDPNHGLMAINNFPFCVDLGLPITEQLGLEHPLDPFIPGCEMDGPGCLEFYTVHWPETETGVPMEVEFTTSTEDLSFVLLDANQKVVAEAETYPTPTDGLLKKGPLRSVDQSPIITKRLYIPQLEAGFYLLAIGGKRALYDVEFMAPPVERVRRGDVNLDGEISKKDILSLTEHLSGKRPLLNDLARLAADLNRDGHLDEKDLMILVRRVGNRN